MTLLRFCSATVCCSNSTTADNNDVAGDDNTLIATDDALAKTPKLVPIASSFCRFSLLSSLTTNYISSSSAASPAIAVSRQSPPILCVASESEIALYRFADFCRIIAFSAAGPGSGATKSAVFSPDGTRIFTAHQDCRIRIWSALSSDDKSRRHRHRLIATVPTVSDFLRHFILPRNYVVVRRYRRALWIKHVDVVSSLSVANDLLYSASWDKTIKIWNTSSSNFRCIQTLTAHEDAINAIAVSSEGTIYSSSSDARIKIWTKSPSQSPPENKRKKRQKHELKATLESHSSAVTALALSPDGSILYSAASDRSIMVWEKSEAAELQMVATVTLMAHDKAVMCLATVDDLVISGSTDRTVKIWQRGDGYRCLAVLAGHQTGVRSLVACHVGDVDGGREYRVCSGSVDGEVRVWKVIMSLNLTVHFG